MENQGEIYWERKRDILIRELRHNVYDAERTRENLTESLTKAYESLMKANLAKGSETVESVALGSSFEAEYLIDYRSIMGVTVPASSFQAAQPKPDYGFANTSVELDKAFMQFYRMVELLATPSEAEGTAPNS